MRNLIAVLLVYIAIIGIGYVIDVSRIAIEHKFMLAILISIVFVILIKRLSKRMSELENTIFAVVLIATFATTWVLRDVKRGSFSLYTFLALFALAGGVARVVYLLIRRKRKVIDHE
jgi:hypothetical protein